LRLAGRDPTFDKQTRTVEGLLDVDDNVKKSKTFHHNIILTIQSAKFQLRGRLTEIGDEADTESGSNATVL
jgi:hypothetical protein